MPRKSVVRLRTTSGSIFFTAGFYLYVAVALPYLAWRIAIVNWHVWYGPAVLIAEIYNIAMSALFLFIARRIDEPVFRRAKLDHHTIDVLIPTYNEPSEILEPTVRAALAIRGIRNVLVLDDGNRDWVKALTDRVGAQYYPRTTNLHAKAGNMNNGLMHTDAEFLICLDADHVPVAHFAERTLGYFEDANLAFVQAPQLFYNTDTFTFRPTRRGVWSEQGMFYDVIQPAKNRWNAAFFVGTTAMLRRSALDSVDGFATGTATEDIHTSLRLHAKGWRSLYIKEALAHGLEAENLKEYVKQRRRWAAGSLGLLLRSPDSPLRARGLSLVQRLNYLNACMAHVLGVQKLFYFVLPIACVIALASPTAISWAHASLAIFSFALFSIGLTAWFARGTYHLIYSEAYNLSHFLAHISGLWGIIRVQRKFSVSEKVVVRRQRTWLKGYWWGIAIASVVATIGTGYLLAEALNRHQSSVGLLEVSLAFIIYNAVIIMTFFGNLLVYERRTSSLEPPHMSAPPATKLQPAFYEALPTKHEPTLHI